jgi:hypothetical protein
MAVSCPSHYIKINVCYRETHPSAPDPFRTLNITNGISIDTDYKFIYRKKQSCDLVQILKGLEPFHDYIEGISIESTWLVLAGGWTDNYSATQKSGLSSLE